MNFFYFILGLFGTGVPNKTAIRGGSRDAATILDVAVALDPPLAITKI